MDGSQIARINELYHKSKSVGLTKEEKLEQQELRNAYIAAIRADLQSTLDNVDILEKDNTVTHLKDLKKNG